LEYTPKSPAKQGRLPKRNRDEETLVKKVTVTPALPYQKFDIQVKTGYIRDVKIITCWYKEYIMAKNLCLAALVLTLIAGGLFSQEQERAKNTIAITGGVYPLSVELSYERALSSHFSVLIDGSYSDFLIFSSDSSTSVMNEYAAAVKGRWYPWAKTFFLELGAGYGNGLGLAGGAAYLVTYMLTFGLVDLPPDIFRANGLLISPGLGWKIDIGKPNGFVLPVNVGNDLIVDFSHPGFVDFIPYARIGLGYSF
jgi:hypothetical protein